MRSIQLCNLLPAAGMIGVCAGNPTYLALIRMQADATLPATQCQNYVNAFPALYYIVEDEEVLVEKCGPYRSESNGTEHKHACLL